MLYDTRHDIEVIEAVVMPVMADWPRAKGSAQECQRFVNQLAAVLHILAEGLVFQRRKAAPDTQFQTPAGQNIEGCDPLGHVHGVVQRQRDDGMPQTDTLCSRGNRAEHDFRFGDMGVGPHEVMLNQPRTAVTESVSQCNFFENLPVERNLVTGKVIARKGEFVEEIEADQIYSAKTNGCISFATWGRCRRGRVYGWAGVLSRLESALYLFAGSLAPCQAKISLKSVT